MSITETKKITCKIIAAVILLCLTACLLISCTKSADAELTDKYWYSADRKIALYFHSGSKVDLYTMKDSSTYSAKTEGSYIITDKTSITMTFSNTYPIQNTYSIANGILRTTSSDDTITQYTILDVKNLTEETTAAPSDTDSSAESSDTASETISDYLNVTEVESYSENAETFLSIGDYKGLKINTVSGSVFDDEIEKQVKSGIIDYLINANAYSKVTDRKAETGDTVSVNFNIYINEFRVNTESEYSGLVTIGGGISGEEFENALIGAEPGGEKVNVFMSDETYGTKENNVRYSIQVDFIYKFDESALEDEKIAATSDFKSYDELVASLKSAAEEELTSTINTYKLNSAWQYAYDNIEVIKYPSGAVEEYYDTLMLQYTYTAAQSGTVLSQYVSQNYDISYDEFKVERYKEAQEMIKAKLIICALSAKEGIELSDEEYETRALIYAKDNGYTTVAEFEKDYGESEIRYSILRDKITEYLADTIEEVPETDSSNVSES